MIDSKKRLLGKIIIHSGLFLPQKLGRFQFNGKSLPYFCHPYNYTWVNERCVEVPIAMDWVKPGLRILEVGRVLPHYFDFSHDCVDKFEKGAMNVDVVDFKATQPYDLIVSISTLEHVGWDEDKDPTKIFRAIENLKSNLAPGGKLVVTFGLGYNHDLDKALKAGTKLLDQEYYFMRNKLGGWKQLQKPGFREYNFGYSWANSLYVGVTGKEE